MSFTERDLPALRGGSPWPSARPPPSAVVLALAVVTGLGLAHRRRRAGRRPTGPGPHRRVRAAAGYRVLGPRTLADRNAVARTGAAIDYSEHGVLYVSATAVEAAAIAGSASGWNRCPSRPPPRRRRRLGALAFPPADSNYHDYAEMIAEVNQVVADHPAIARKISIGTSYEGRDLMAVKISDNVGTDEDEPEVLFNAHQHAREHLTVEMALYLLQPAHRRATAPTRGSPTSSTPARSGSSPT